MRRFFNEGHLLAAVWTACRKICSTPDRLRGFPQFEAVFSQACQIILHFLAHRLFHGITSGHGSVTPHKAGRWTLV
jgi:hypothetical protein